MKSCSRLMVILVLQAVLVTGILAATAEETEWRQIEKTDPGGPLITPGVLQCCSKCNFSNTNLYTCGDVVKKCDPVCTKCVKKGKQGLFQCADHFLGLCGPPCKKNN